MMPTLREILFARRRAGGGPPFRDGYRVALVSEGGAMRGVVAGGMVSAIEAAGMSECFDLMIGTSAGAAALAYLRAGQARFGTRIYYEDINNRAFIDPRRLLWGRAIVDIDFLVDHIFRVVKPLNVERLAAPGARLVAVATDVVSGAAVPLEGFDDATRVYEILRATTRMPILTAGPVSIEGRRYVDGSVTASLPIAFARKLGATHVLVIMTRSSASPAVAQNARIKASIQSSVFAALYHRNLLSATRRDKRDYRKTYHVLADGKRYVIGGIPHWGVAPASDFSDVSRIERDEQKLRRAADHGFERMHAFLSS